MKDIISGIVGETINTSIISDYLENQKPIILNSGGGSLFEAFAIHDFLTSKNNETIFVNGVCASAATIILLSAKNRIASENSRFLIHFPMNAANGDASIMQKTADELSKEQENLINFYVKKLNKDYEIIKNLMASEKFLTPDEALEIGLITKINKTMEINENSIVDKIFNKIKDFIAPQDVSIKTIKNIILQDVNGTELDFGSADEIIVGLENITENGELANGEFKMPDGKILIIEKGKIIEIKEMDEELENAKKENLELKSKVENLTTTIFEIKNEIEKFKKMTSTEKAPCNLSISIEEESKKPFTYKSKRNL